MDFDDEDLKELWDTDLNATMQDTLKMSSYADMQDWMDRDSKLPPVILNDKLMTDAIIGGTGMPIKTEHSYSLNSDGDSISDTLPDSPHSLQNKMDDMEEECYPAISMNGQNKQHIIHRHSGGGGGGGGQIPAILSAASGTVLSALNGSNALKNSIGGGFNLLSTLQQQQQQLQQQVQQSHHLVLGQPITLNNNHLTINNNHLKESNSGSSLLLSSGYSSKRSDSSSSSSGSVASDIEIDEMTVKEEPMSPSSSCPPSPTGAGASGTVLGGYSISTVNLANMAAYTQSDLVLEHKNGTLQLTPASQSLLKNQQQLVLSNGTTICTTTGGTVPSQQPAKIVMSKLNIKMEPQSTSSTSSSFGLPPTPPSSLPSDESEGNQSPEHHASPMSPPAVIASAVSPGCSSSSSSSSSSSCGGSTPSSRRTSVHGVPASGSSSGGMSTSSSSPNARAAVAAASQNATTRQPIHTPLISSQPKGSTGTLMLTEEEKRTLLAEGYPIPTRLPLTKAEEKSLKKIRRKIKNKISAQESRRKKKEYMDQLERRVEILVSENLDYRKRVESLEDANQSLTTELAKLRALISRQQAARKM